MTLWRGGGAETAASSATCGTDDLEGALAREHGRLVRVARAERDWIAPRYTAPARTRPRSPRAAPRAAPRASSPSAAGTRPRGDTVLVLWKGPVHGVGRRAHARRGAVDDRTEPGSL